MDGNIYIKRLGTVDSTNRYARDKAATLWSKAGSDSIIAVTAEHQTAGRGQRGNSWQSQPGCNLLLTLLVKPGEALEATRQFLLSQTVAVALHSAMKEYGIDTSLKWPNDIYVGKKKLAGILIELDYSGHFIEQATIGIGLNVNQTGFPPMERTPVSMHTLTGIEFDVEEVLCRVLGKFKEYYTMLTGGNGAQIASEYGKLLLGAGSEQRFIDADGEFCAIICGVEPCGKLMLRTADGETRRYAFKEVEMIL